MAVRNQTELEKVIKEHSTFLSKFEAFAEKAERSFMDIKQILDKLVNNQSKSDGGTSTSQLEINSNTRTDRLYRLGKIEFPKFNGSEVEDWACRCEHFFDVDDTPENFKVRFAAINLEGKAMKWHSAYLKTSVKPISEITWSEYSRNIIDRFSTNLFHDAMGLLTSTVQVGSLEDYYEKFDENFLRVTICEEYTVSIFLNGLKSELRCPVSMFGPKKLKESYEMAKNQVNLLAIFDSYKGFKNEEIKEFLDDSRKGAFKELVNETDEDVTKSENGIKTSERNGEFDSKKYGKVVEPTQVGKPVRLNDMDHGYFKVWLYKVRVKCKQETMRSWLLKWKYKVQGIREDGMKVGSGEIVKRWLSKWKYKFKLSREDNMKNGIDIQFVRNPKNGSCCKFEEFEFFKLLAKRHRWHNWKFKQFIFIRMFNGCCLRRKVYMLLVWKYKGLTEKYFRPPHSSSSILRNLHRIPSGYNPNKQSLTLKPFLTNALTESSDSPKSLDPKFLLQELADSFNLPSDYFSQLPRDLRLDLNDTAFDLSNGPVMERCGQELGMTSKALVNDLPSLVNSLTSNNKSALGKRLTSAGRRFQSMGQYGQAKKDFQSYDFNWEAFVFNSYIQRNQG
ncbi:putative retrotransposon gag domain-containing protein [Helianthus annuus]|nr:putative retrotransposon gag domain-containing protein [Helianthus annuus]